MLSKETFEESMAVLHQRWPFPASAPNIKQAWELAVWRGCQQLDEQKFIKAVLDLVDAKDQYGRPSPEQIRLRAGGEVRVPTHGPTLERAQTEAEFVARTGWTRAEMQAYWDKTARPKLAALQQSMSERARLVIHPRPDVKGGAFRAYGEFTKRKGKR